MVWDRAFERSNVQIPMFLYVRTIFSISQPRVILKVLLYHTIDININANINKIYVEREYGNR